MGMFDFNGDGHTDSGEQFTGYQVFKDVTGSSSGKSGNSFSRGRLDGYDIFIIAIVVYAILNALCK